MPLTHSNRLTMPRSRASLKMPDHILSGREGIAMDSTTVDKVDVRTEFTLDMQVEEEGPSPVHPADFHELNPEKV